MKGTEVKSSPSWFEALKDIPDSVIVSDVSYRVLFWNRAAEALYGIREADALGRQIEDLVVLVDAPLSRREIRRLLQENGSWHGQVQHASANGCALWVDWSISRGRTEDGTPYHLGITRDIGALKRTEAALRESEERFRVSFDKAAIGKAWSSIEGCFIRVNEVLAALWGYSPSELVGRSFFEITHPDDRDTSLSVMKSLLDGAPNAHFEKRYLRRDGSSVWMDVNLVAVRDANGRILHFIGDFIDLTAQKQTHEELRQSRIKLEAALASMTDAVLISDTAGRFVHFNQAFATFHRFECKEQCAKTLAEYPDFLEVRLPDGTPAPLEMWAVSRALRGEAVSNAEYLLRRKDTGERWVGSYSFGPIRSPEGAIIGSVVAGRDVTAGKRAEEALLQSEKRYHDVFDSSLAALFIQDSEAAKILDVNQTALRVYGYTDKQELLNCRVEDLSAVEEGYTEAKVREMNRLASDANTYSFEWRAKRKGGERFWAQVNLQTIHLDGERRILVSVLDITDRKRMEEALSESEEKFRIAFRTSPDSINLNRVHDGVYVDINEGFTRIMGYTREEIIGRSSLEMDIWKSEEDRQRLVRALAQNGYYENLEACFVNKDGSLRYGLMSACLIKVDKEDLILSITRDITERVRSEEERTRLQEQLQQAMKMEAVGRLAGGVAHDFNNLLTGITGHISLALMDLRPDDPLVESLTEVHNAAESAATLTRQLLAFSRKQIIEPKILDINDILSSLEKMLVRLIGEDIELTMCKGASLGAVKIDPGQVEQILVNLVVNARDAMPGGGKLLIQTGHAVLEPRDALSRPGAKPGEYVTLEVCDTGEGMSAEVQKHLFEPFFTTKPMGRGTGLGLATIYGTITQAEGFIDVRSELGKGTTFTLYLPRINQKAEGLSKPDRTQKLPGGKETILLVEDENIVRDLAFRILKRQGYTVFAVPDAGQALLLAEKHPEPIHLLFTDIVMPGLNGRQLANRLAQIHPEMRILYTSGYTEDAIAIHGVLEAGLDFIAKPYGPLSLAKRVREVLDKRQD